MSGELYERLNTYAQTESYPFHMPGHKRNPESGALSELYKIDITEIEGFDNLHDADGILADAQKRASRLYGAEETHFLINGSTGGILSAVACISHPKKVLLMARNCHKSVYHAAFLNRLDTRYLFPDMIKEYDIPGKIGVDEVRRKIISVLHERNIHPEKAASVIAGVVITSPTYEGICSEVREIAELVHKYGLPLIVDEAHGAHLGFYEEYPESAVQAGADIVIQSVHKTLPSPTQTALLHCKEGYINIGKLRSYLAIYQTSSPSYVLMTGIDEAVALMKREGKERLSTMLLRRKQIEKEISSCRYLRICPDTEPSKLVISVKNTIMNGKELDTLLRERYHLQMEMACGSYVLAMMSVMDCEEGILRLIQALKEIDKELDFREAAIPGKEFQAAPVRKYKIHEAYLQESEEISLEEAAGKTAASFVNLYPPGIPILVPGEIIQEDAIKKMKDYLCHGYSVQGITGQKIQIIKKEEENS